MINYSNGVPIQCFLLLVELIAVLYQSEAGLVPLVNGVSRACMVVTGTHTTRP